MTIDELIRTIEKEELAMPSLYGKGSRKDTVVLERDNQTWLVYVTDQHESIMAKTQRTFTAEAEALEYVLTKLRQIQKANWSLKELFKKKRVSSAPTHIRQVNGSHREPFRDNLRPYPEAIRFTLNRMDGASFWAFALWPAPKGTDFSKALPESSTYMQCIGSAEAMMIEVRHPDPDDPTIVYRLIVGKPGDYSGEPSETLVWDEGRQHAKVYPGELFTADEAAAILYGYFDATAVAKYYRFRNATVIESTGAGATTYEIASVEEMKRQQLNAAITAYIGDNSFPRHNEAAAKEFAGAGEEATELLSKVKEVVDGALSVEIDWSTHTLTQAGDEVKRVMAARYPGLNDKALDKLAWIFMYSNK